MDYTSVGGGGVNDGAAACSDADMAADYDDVACLDRVKAGYSLVSARIAPAAGGKIGLAYAGLIQAPVDKSGTVK